MDRRFFWLACAFFGASAAFAVIGPQPAAFGFGFLGLVAMCADSAS